MVNGSPYPLSSVLWIIAAENDSCRPRRGRCGRNQRGRDGPTHSLATSFRFRFRHKNSRLDFTGNFSNELSFHRGGQSHISGRQDWVFILHIGAKK